MPQGVRNLILEYFGDPSRPENSPQVFRTILAAWRSEAAFSYFKPQIPEDLPLDKCAEKARAIFLEVFYLHEVNPLYRTPGFEEVALLFERMSCFQAVCEMMKFAEPKAISSFLSFFGRLSLDNQKADEFLRGTTIGGDAHSAMEVCRNWMMKNLQELSKMERLNLSFEDVTGTNPNTLSIFPVEVTWLKGLKILDIRASYIRRLPDEIENLSELTELIANGNSLLHQLPATIKNLKKLKTINLQFCPRLQGLPKEIGELPALKLLDSRFSFSSGQQKEMGIVAQAPKRKAWYSQEMVQQAPLLPDFLEKLRKRGCKVLI